MIQTIETTDQEKYKMYNSLEKDVLIGMLIESNKHLERLNPNPKISTNSCGIYMPSGGDTSGRCMFCGKQNYEH